MANREAGAQQGEQRLTEGGRRGEKAPESRKRVGRPKGSRNKPKSLVPADVATTLLMQMKDQLPPEQFAYMKGVIQRGEAVSTIKEVDVLVTLMRGSLMPYLAHEAIPQVVCDEDGNPEVDEDGNVRMRYPGIDKDVSDRLAKLTSLLQLKHNIERRADDERPEGEQPIIQVFAKRGIDPDRLKLLVGYDGTAPSTPRLVGAGEAPDARDEAEPERLRSDAGDAAGDLAGGAD